ncbi:methionine--tRNA ligase [Candidatus Peregrinibacteria bacterium CG_4_9_14_0_2_um_filter_53_11]|nr:MAG: methionine--tRNA ligase [Candidatus Peregrinibacteria bacterium CG_4_9_14_0_2_um_filter_53_11]
MSKFYITTAIAYTNSTPHIGFAMELIQGDCLARYHRLVGDEVFFLTGTDEHGLKMAQTAKEKKTTPQKLADTNAAHFKRLAEFVEASNDDFIRTTEERHKKGAQKLWNKLVEADTLYKKTYEGLYCVGCEAYITEKDLVDGLCPNHKKPPITFKEENYFFRYTKYMQEVKERIEDGRLQILPDSRKNEMLGLLEQGLKEKKDISFSRPTKDLSWGIPVPNDPEQTMYVWCDALSNYITGLGYGEESELFNTFWPANVHLIGKDILRFHGGIWIAMLIAAGVGPPKAIYVHGYITSEGQKMSKSLGNVVDPFETGKKYGVDALRYFLLREIPTTDDGDFSQDRFMAVYDSELANNLGNLVSRVLTMTQKYAEGKVPASSKNEALETRVLETWKEYQKNFEQFNLKGALESVVNLLNTANQYLEEQKPWILAKTDPSAVLKTLYHTLEILRHISLMIMPFIPATAQKLQDGLNWHGTKLYPDNINWGILKEGTQTQKLPSLFPRLESKEDAA